MVFGFRKKDKVVDLGEKFKKQQEKLREMRESARETNSQYPYNSLNNSNSTSPMQSSENSTSQTSSNPVADGLNFLGNIASASSSNSNTTSSNYGSTTSNYSSSDNKEYVDMGSTINAEEKRKRLMAITEKLEDISNQLYHLQQRVEVIEKKMAVGVGTSY